MFACETSINPFVCQNIRFDSVVSGRVEGWEEEQEENRRIFEEMCTPLAITQRTVMAKISVFE
jgi:hypothetical protein